MYGKKDFLLFSINTIAIEIKAIDIYCFTTWLAFPILIKKEAPFSRKEFQIYLEERKIQTRVVFTGNINRQPMCKNIKKVVQESGYPNADAVMERGVLLPLHHGLTDQMFNRFHKVIDDFIETIKDR
tara:strand:- start:119 stop:499 length:381 start_codon:yes stop_codon:yes gene_type:complete